MEYNDFEKQMLKLGIKEEDLYNENRIPKNREKQWCSNCKNSCVGQFGDNRRTGDCEKRIPKRISAEEKYLRAMFFPKKER